MLERPEDGKVVSLALVLRIALAVVIQGTLTTVWQTCQESSRDWPRSTLLLPSESAAVGVDTHADAHVGVGRERGFSEERVSEALGKLKTALSKLEE